MEKETIKGAIIIYSCQKYKNKRLTHPNFGLKKIEYNGWKVFYILGNPLLEQEYIQDNNIITIKCEDSYLHLMKKVVMGYKVILDLYNIEEGIIKSDDDLVFNEEILIDFLKKTDKTDYMGKLACLNTTNKISIMKDTFVIQYYINHQNDFKNPLNGMTHMTLNDIFKLNVRPHVSYCGGPCYYISKNVCEILIDHMRYINWNILKSYPEYGYPYIIEDVGIGFILFLNNIHLTKYDLYCDVPNNNVVAYHTNEYK